MSIRIPFTERAEAFDIDVSLVSDRGTVRSVNEDAGVVVSRPQDGDTHILVVVADGMGGHVAGERASRAAVDIIPKAFFASSKPPRVALSNAIGAANRYIEQISRTDAALRGMGTTVAAIALCESRLVVAHVGDSRVYRVRNERIEALTRDHSLVRDLVRQGIITELQAEDHPDSHVILRALGVQPHVDVETTRPLSPQAGDRYLLCSDGVSDVVTEAELLELTKQPAALACNDLIALANRRGGQDNATIAVLKLMAPGTNRQIVPATRS